MLSKFTAFIAGIKWVILALVIGLVIGGFTGWYEKSIRVEAEQRQALVDVRKEDFQNAADMRAKEGEIANKRNDLDNRFSVITKEVTKYVPKTVYVDKVREVLVQDSTMRKPDVSAVCEPNTLSVVAVRLLNSARENRDFEPTSVSNAESETATDIGLQELVESDIEVAEQYHELAIAHDALVDYVNGLIEQQRQEFAQE